MRLFALLLILVAAIWAAKIPLDSREAHREADAVLWPKFVAISNDWAIHHGKIDDPAHLEKIDAQDKQRFYETCEAFDVWRKAMKQAGY